LILEVNRNSEIELESRGKGIQARRVLLQSAKDETKASEPGRPQVSSNEGM